MSSNLSASSARMASSLQRCALRSTTSVPVRSFVSLSTKAGIITRLPPVPLKTRYYGFYPQLRNDSWSRITPSAAYSTSTSSHGRELTADDYIQELQDLYEIAKDELEIADESTTAGTIYAASDRVTLREAFDDLDRAYAAYTGTTPTGPSGARTAADMMSTTAGARTDAESGNMGMSGEVGMGTGEEGEISAAEQMAEQGELEGEGEGERRPRTNYDPKGVTPEIREEIQRRIGQRMREMRSAVEALEERAKED